MKTNYVIKSVRGIADLQPMDGEIEGKPVFLMTRINIPQEHRGKGHGSALLQKVLADARKTQSVIQLHVSPSGGLTRGDLVQWYRRYGFTGVMVMNYIPPTISWSTTSSPKTTRTIAPTVDAD